MTLTNTTVADNWSSVVTGPTTQTSTISSKTRSVEIAIAATPPLVTDKGFTVSPEDSYNFVLDAGENLYCKSKYEGYTVTIVINT